jgi:hypothetical protein
MAEKLENYKADATLSTPQRIAAYLDWAAQVAPGRPVSFQLLTKIVEFCAKLPTEKDHRTLRIKTSVRRAQKHLRELYGRGIVSHPGYGVRATTGDADFAATRFQTDKKRFVSSAKALDISQSMIKPSNIQDKELRNSVLAVKSTFKILVQHDILNKLQLPPKTETE